MPHCTVGIWPCDLNIPTRAVALDACGPRHAQGQAQSCLERPQNPGRRGIGQPPPTMNFSSAGIQNCTEGVRERVGMRERKYHNTHPPFSAPAFCSTPPTSLSTCWSRRIRQMRRKHGGSRCRRVMGQCVGCCKTARCAPAPGRSAHAPARAGTCLGRPAQLNMTGRHNSTLPSTTRPTRRCAVQVRRVGGRLAGSSRTDLDDGMVHEGADPLLGALRGQAPRLLGHPGDV